MSKTARTSRRSVLAGGLALTGTTLLPTPRALADSAPALRGGLRLSTVTRSDSRYATLQTGNNKRFLATPETIDLVTGPGDVRDALQRALDGNKKVSVRGGGHCFEDFVCSPDVQAIIDTSHLTHVGYDDKLRAFVVEPGARLLNVYQTLSNGWGVTLPGGICYSVGAGGHIPGGGYGLLSRAHGLICDHLYAIEITVVDERRKTRTVLASRDDSGPLKDLWWAHTGGGGGNFGVVTKYWFRSPGTDLLPPTKQLPAIPATVLVSTYELAWEQITEPVFKRLLTNHGRWHERFSSSGTPESQLSCLFNVTHSSAKSMGVFTQIDASAPSASRVVDEYNRALLEGTGIRPKPATAPTRNQQAAKDPMTPRRLPWLDATRLVGANNPTITDPTARGIHKSAYMKKAFDDEQLTVLYQAMTKEGFNNPNTMLVLFSFGGRVNDIPADATANAQRSSAFKFCLQTFWADNSDDNTRVSWERDTYARMFQRTGGAPVPNDQVDGCYINYPDKDMRDPAVNRSGVPWSTLYYKGNYPRLQRVKRAWDPTNFFRHSLSIELPG